MDVESEKIRRSYSNGPFSFSSALSDPIDRWMRRLNVDATFEKNDVVNIAFLSVKQIFYRSVKKSAVFYTVSDCTIVLVTSKATDFFGAYQWISWGELSAEVL